MGALRLEFRKDDRRLHDRLLRLREAPAVPKYISAIRILDVLAWMDGQGYANGFPDRVDRLASATATRN